MLNIVIRYALNHRLTVLFLVCAASIYGLWVTVHLPVDVFPNLNRPRVTVLTEAHGLAPEEVETLVTLPIETALNGAPGVIEIRSSSGIGISIVYVEFDWGTDIYRNRQLVSERLQLVRERLPKEMTPTMGPVSSLMGEIQFVGLLSPDKSVPPMELRDIADWVLRPQLMTIGGVSQVIVMGGEVKQYHILVSSEKLRKKRIPIEDLEQALSEISENTTGGFLNLEGKEYLIRPLGRVQSIEEIEDSIIGMHFGTPVKVKDIAEVKIGHRIKRGEGSVNGQHAVIMTIQKQPEANTLVLTQKIEAALKTMRKAMPPGVEINSDLFKQANFIEASIDNVKEALRDGTIMVAVIIFFFLLNLRTTTITLLAIPVSLLVTAIVFKWLGLSINTMTLGGMAIAIGELVDDAIVDVENVYRRLKENKAAGSPMHALSVVYKASSEVRNSIVISTMIVVLVFVPLFSLSGIEGRLFAPLGVAYIIALLASLVVSLTLTPVLCYYFLPNAKFMEDHRDGALVRFVKLIDRKVLNVSLDSPYWVIGGSLILLAGSLSLIPLMGRNFLPTFNEGSATVGIASHPGISLPASDELGMKMEKSILSIPEVKSTIRRTGRAELDEHAEGVHWSEIDVDFYPKGRPRALVLDEIRHKVHDVADVYVNVGQPISHRLDHLLSGIRSQIAIKIFGPELAQLRLIAGEIQDAISGIDGLVDLQTEPLVLVPQLKALIDREAAGEAHLNVGHLAQDLETALNGAEVGYFIQNQRLYELYMRFDDESRASPEKIEDTVVTTLPTGEIITLGDVASIYKGTGPNMVNRESVQRRIVVQANSNGRDLASLVGEVQKNIDKKIKLPEGYFIEMAGQFKSQQEANEMIAYLGALSLLCIFLVLYVNFRSVTLSLQVMINVPLALIGSVIVLYFTERTLSVATLIAFITLCGIATRNGILMVSHYLYLMKHEGETFSKEMVLRGSLERLVPVLMTALSAALALVPLLFAKGEAGKEILYPVALVIVGGLVSSTFLDILVTPTLFFNFGRKAAEKHALGTQDPRLNSAGELS
jgi:CzcA family heavy metal efflux pump